MVFSNGSFHLWSKNLGIVHDYTIVEYFFMAHLTSIFSNPIYLFHQNFAWHFAWHTVVRKFCPVMASSMRLACARTSTVMSPKAWRPRLNGHVKDIYNKNNMYGQVM